MFSEIKQGVYKDSVKFYAGVSDNIVHVTLCDLNNDNLYYDFMTEVYGMEMFKEKLSSICENYLRYLEEKENSTEELCDTEVPDKKITKLLPEVT